MDFLAQKGSAPVAETLEPSNVTRTTKSQKGHYFWHPKGVIGKESLFIGEVINFVQIGHMVTFIRLLEGASPLHTARRTDHVRNGSVTSGLCLSSYGSLSFQAALLSPIEVDVAHLRFANIAPYGSCRTPVTQ
ncbi:hypothetical protein ACFC0C_22850 [Streptomyces sp. NPDC056178]|uniref:hypothetical protein n=1 Tax=Streptomyces sp. NPDC056178 TaxID=3345735 RepID=UPI0035DFA65D